MEQKRIILLVVLVFLGSMLWHDWTQEHQPVPTPTVSTPTTATNSGAVSNNVNIPLGNSRNTSVSSSTPTLTNTATPSTQNITVKTDVLDITINPQGGTITQSALLQYPLVQGQPQPVILLNNNSGSQYLAQSSLVSSDGSFSDSNLVYNTTQTAYELDKDQQQLVVNLTAQTNNGLKIIKSFTFTPDKYNIDVTYHIQNNGNAPWEGSVFGLLSRTDNSETSGLFRISAYTGASVSTKSSPYQKLSFKAIQKSNLNTSSTGGWVAMQQHYFLSAWVPNQQQDNRFFTQVDNNNLYTVGLQTAQINAQPGQTVTTNLQLYTGPELADQLKSLAPHLDLTIDYGWLWFISAAIFWLMQKIYNVVGNWGWAIVLVTVLIKLAFYHLSATSYRSMAKMRKLQPKIEALKQRYGDDRQKMAQATMELYRHEKANPMSGCLPILIQIPVFIALYWVLVESVQLRQAPFIFWIHDLSSRDPYFILPLLNGLAMFVQSKLNPAPADPTQAKMMMLLPLLFTVIFINFPAGLVLYWVVNSVISIAQQWYIMEKVAKEGDKSVVVKA